VNWPSATQSSLSADQFNLVSVGISHNHCPGKPERRYRQLIGGNEFNPGGSQISRSVPTKSEHANLPNDEVVCAFIDWKRPAIAGRKVLEEFHARSRPTAQRSDPQMSAKNVGQMFLFCAVVLTFADNPKAQKVTIELETPFRFTNDNRRVVNPEKEPVRRVTPLRLTFV
jgi:hypothetical protein